MSDTSVLIHLARIDRFSLLYRIYFRWPEYVRDPDDTHVLDTAVAASCPHLVTFNKSDFHRASALNVQLLTPREFLTQIDNPS